MDKYQQFTEVKQLYIQYQLEAKIKGEVDWSLDNFEWLPFNVRHPRFGKLLLVLSSDMGVGWARGPVREVFQPQITESPWLSDFEKTKRNWNAMAVGRRANLFPFVHLWAKAQKLVHATGADYCADRFRRVLFPQKDFQEWHIRTRPDIITDEIRLRLPECRAEGGKLKSTEKFAVQAPSYTGR